MGIKFEGLDSLEKRLSNNEVEKKMQDGVLLNTTEFFDDAKRTSPVDSGEMQRSHFMDISNDGLTGEVGVSVYYGVYVNGGTRHQEAQPWFTTSFNKQKPKFLADMNRVMDE